MSDHNRSRDNRGNRDGNVRHNNNKGRSKSANRSGRSADRNSFKSFAFCSGCKGWLYHDRMWDSKTCKCGKPWPKEDLALAMAASSASRNTQPGAGQMQIGNGEEPSGSPSLSDLVALLQAQAVKEGKELPQGLDSFITTATAEEATNTHPTSDPIQAEQLWRAAMRNLYKIRDKGLKHANRINTLSKELADEKTAAAETATLCEQYQQEAQTCLLQLGKTRPGAEAPTTTAPK